jgi:hypothetical protein
VYAREDGKVAKDEADGEADPAEREEVVSWVAKTEAKEARSKEKHVRED